MITVLVITHLVALLLGALLGFGATWGTAYGKGHDDGRKAVQDSMRAIWVGLSKGGDT